MCFYIEKSNNKILVAEEDIVVYKYGETLFFGLVFLSPFHIFFYLKGKKARRVKLTIKTTKYLEVIERGYHTYSKEMSDENANKGVVLAEFIIPKGTLYFKNKSQQEYVSETLIFKRVIKKF